MEDEILNKLQDVVRDVLDNETIELDMDKYFSEIEGWDSLKFITILATIQDEYKINFTMEEMDELKTIKSIVGVLSRKLKS